jgi:hypothetical protein
MNHYLNRLRDISHENAPPPGTAITAKSPSDSFGSSEGSRISEPAPGDPLADGWRRRLATDAWHRDWTAVWKRGSAAVSPAELAFVVADLVNAWNVCTGDRRKPAEYLKHLSPIDHADSQIMCRGWLALYCWTLWHREENS